MTIFRPVNDGARVMRDVATRAKAESALTLSAHADKRLATLERQVNELVKILEVVQSNQAALHAYITDTDDETAH